MEKAQHSARSAGSSDSDRCQPKNWAFRHRTSLRGECATEKPAWSTSQSCWPGALKCSYSDFLMRLWSLWCFGLLICSGWCTHFLLRSALLCSWRRPHWVPSHVSWVWGTVDIFSQTWNGDDKSKKMCSSAYDFACWNSMSRTGSSQCKHPPHGPAPRSGEGLIFFSGSRKIFSGSKKKSG